VAPAPLLHPIDEEALEEGELREGAPIERTERVPCTIALAKVGNQRQSYRCRCEARLFEWFEQMSSEGARAFRPSSSSLQPALHVSRRHWSLPGPRAPAKVSGQALLARHEQHLQTKPAADTGR
jgi:hypothetical protein